MSVRQVAALIILVLTVPVLRGQTATTVPNSRPQSADLGSLENGIYRNPRFGFQFKVPLGWADRTEQMRGPTSDQEKSLLLLAIFERPPEAQGEPVNSAVIITAENVSAYPGVKSAADYFGPLSDVVTGKGFAVVNEPYYFEVGAKKVVRGDFSKKAGDVVAYQSSIVILEKGYFVSFTFLGADDDEVNELIEKLSFMGATSKKASAAK